MVDDIINAQKEKYPKLSRLVDTGALLVLVAAVFMPIVRFGYLTQRLADQQYSVVMFGGIALVGLLASLAKKRWVVVVAAAAYGGLFALDIAYVTVSSFEWGCAVITLCVLLVFLSKAVARSVER